MILFYLFFLASRAIPNSIPRRVPRNFHRRSFSHRKLFGVKSRVDIEILKTVAEPLAKVISETKGYQLCWILLEGNLCNWSKQTFVEQQFVINARKWRCGVVDQQDLEWLVRIACYESITLYDITGGMNKTELMSLTDISLAFLILTLPPLYVIYSI